MWSLFGSRTNNDYLSIGYAATKNRVRRDRRVVLLRCQLAQGTIQRKAGFDDRGIPETRFNDAAVYCPWSGDWDIFSQTHPAKGI